jgi:flagellar export protein FliJ
VKRFAWKLQRVLDITAQREKVLKGELFALARAIVQVREAVAARRAVLRTLLAELAERRLQERLAEQVIFLDSLETAQREIRRLAERLNELEEERTAAQQQFLRTRSMRRALERRREQALKEHQKEIGKREQGAFDEIAHVAFTRETVRKQPAAFRP